MIADRAQPETVQQMLPIATTLCLPLVCDSTLRLAKGRLALRILSRRPPPRESLGRSPTQQNYEQMSDSSLPFTWNKRAGHFLTQVVFVGTLVLNRRLFRPIHCGVPVCSPEEQRGA